MKKLNKSFSGTKRTVEAMWDSCTGGCSCSVVSCYCSPTKPEQSYSLWNRYQTQHKNAFKNAAY